MRKRLFGASASAVLALALFFPVTVPASGAAAVQPEQVTRDFIEALTIVEAQYAGDVDYPRVSKAAISSMLRVLDPHSSYYDQEEFEAFRTEQQSQYFGIGATIGARNGKVFILAPFPGTPADNAGLRYGDEIVEVDGKSTAGWSSLQVSSAMKGPRGTKVTIRYRRPGVAEPQTAEITRQQVPLPSLTNAYMIAPGVGYIHHQRGFNATSGEEVRAALEELSGEGMKALVYDLRGNPGGLVREAIAIASDFLYKGQEILSIRGRTSQMRGGNISAIGSDTYEIPLVVLVNGGSASASEIVAGALQDHDRALIVGQTSFGKGLVQSPFELGKDGGALILTTGKYYTPSGRIIQRDYSNTSFYDYITRRGQAPAPADDKREVFRTDAGRPIYGGGGISPDVAVEIPEEFGRKQLRWLNAMFGFTAEVVNGQVKGFESYRFQRIVGDHVVANDELVVNDAYLEAFKKFVSRSPEYKVAAADVDANRDFLRNELRRELVTAHYGIEAAEQVSNIVDPQVQRAIREVPQAERMALAFRKNRPAGGGVQAAAR